jgi:hypothetical protein
MQLEDCACGARPTVQLGGPPSPLKPPALVGSRSNMQPRRSLAKSGSLAQARAKSTLAIGYRLLAIRGALAIREALA